MPEKIAILKESGETLNTTIVSIFTIPESGKKYIITTENAVDPHGLTVLHVSEVKGEELNKVATDEEWSSIKTIMRSIISGSIGSYQYQPLITKAKAAAQYSRDISVSATACKQIIDSYENSLKNNPKEEPNKVVSESSNSIPTEPEVKDNAAVTNNPVTGNSIFPANNETSNEENEIIPGITEVKDNKELPQDEETSSDEGASPTKISVENDEKEKDDIPEPTPVVVNENTSLNNITEQKENQVPQLVVEDNNDNLASSAPEPIPVQKENKEESVASPVSPSNTLLNENPNQTSTINDSLDSVISDAQKIIVEELNGLISKITGKLYQELKIREQNLNEREQIINQREKIVNDLISNLSNQSEKLKELSEK